MKINKIRFIEPGNLPYKKSFRNLFTYDKYIRNPSIGLLTLATIAKAKSRTPSCTANPYPKSNGMTS